MKQTNHYELVIDCTGVPKVVENAVKYVKDGGVFLLFGVCPENSQISINPYEIFKREITITSTYALKKTYGKAVKLVRNKKIDMLSLVEHHLPLEDAGDIFEKMVKNSSGLKTVFYPNGR